MSLSRRSQAVRTWALAATLLWVMVATVRAAELTVNVNGIAPAPGQIGCALFEGAGGFPMDNAAARMVWLPADGPRLSCRFTGVSDGTYAVSVLNDVNGNKRVDTNLFGIPTEQWGVSNNVRPALRAPRFDEAAFKVSSSQDLTIEVTIAK